MSAKKVANFVTASVVILGALIFTAGAEASEQSKSLALKYFKAPLRFEPNQGQSVPGIDFVAHGKGYVLHLSSSEAVFAIRHEQLSMRLTGSNNEAQPLPLDPLKSRVNYFVGSDASKWR